jgi:amino acid transporter
LWEAGYFSDAAATLGGPTLRIIIIVAGMLSCFGTFQALMLPVSEQLVELCSPSLLDVSIVRRKWKRFGTHYVAIVFNAVITIGFATVPFESLVDTLNFLHSTVVILVLVSFVSLRFSRKGTRMFRPFSAVSNRWLSIALVFFPMIISMWMIVGIVWLKTWFAAVGCAVMYAIGVGLYYTCRYRKQKGLLWATKMKPKKPSEQRPDSDKLMGDDQDQGEEEEEVEEEEDLGEEKPLLGDNTTAKPIVSGRQQQTGAGGGAINESF